jgi:hypothetical protein
VRSLFVRLSKVKPRKDVRGDGAAPLSSRTFSTSYSVRDCVVRADTNRVHACCRARGQRIESLLPVALGKSRQCGSAATCDAGRVADRWEVSQSRTKATATFLCLLLGLTSLARGRAKRCTYYDDGDLVGIQGIHINLLCHFLFIYKKY